MNDSDVWTVLIALLRTGMSDLGFPQVAVRQNYQPTQQGTPEGPALFLHKLSATRYGSPGHRHVYNVADANFDTTQSVWRTPSYQVSGLAQQNPGAPDAPTASDIVEAAADVMQTPATRQTLLQSGIGILRIRDIRMLYFVNDKDRHEQEPSFDFTLSYRRVVASKTPAVTVFGTNIVRV